MIRVASLDEFLHDSCGLAGFSALHATMCLINDEIQPIALFSDGVGKRLPNGIGAAITIFCEFR